MKNYIQRVWEKSRLPLFVIVISAGTWGWTTFAFLFPPMYQESQKVWQEHLKRQDINIDADSVQGNSEQSVPKTESDANERELSAVNTTDTPSLSVIEKIYETWENKEEAKIAVAIAKSESRLDCSAVGDRHLAFYREGIEYGKSYGVFQIRHLPGRPNPDELLDPNKNIAYAYELYKKSGFSPWSQYKNGRYLSYIE